MNHELAKTLTTALVQFVDKNQPNDKMDVSSIEAEELERCFTEEKFNRVEDWYACRMKPELTEFEESLRQAVVEALSGETPNGSGGTMSWAVTLSDDDVKKLAPIVLAFAKKELLSYADESNPAIEAMADLERTYFCNPDKLPKWLRDDIARKELNAHTNGYNKGYKDAQEATSYHYPITFPMYTPPCFNGGKCTNPFRDCINCPNQNSGGFSINTTDDSN